VYTPESNLRLFPQDRPDSEYPNKVEEWLHVRTSQLQQINNVKLFVTVPGDSRRKVGETVDFLLPSPEPPVNKEEQYDSFLRGKYLISQVRHTIDQSQYETHLQLVKDSVFTPFPG
jgi:hypothetical protein